MALSFNRRAVIAGLAAGSLAPHAAAATSAPARIIVIGGGYGGATAARFIRKFSSGTRVTLIEPNRTFTSCPFSNLVIAGLRDLGTLRFRYEALVAEGIEVIHERAIDVNAEAQSVTLEAGGSLEYDRLVLSPGIDLRWNAIEGYDEAAADRMPHAWIAGAQTSLLRQQLEAMEDGGLVVISAPAAPYRCPPGPYERASLVAHYLKTRKPKSKLLLLDNKDKFSKQPLFASAWNTLYPDIIEWRGTSDDGAVRRVDSQQMQVQTDFEIETASVANIIPPQKAGLIADRAGVTDSTGWCPVNATTFESTLQKNIHVIGDASIAAPMPKSAFAANMQGKICAVQIARVLAGHAPEPAVLANTCYSYTTPGTAFSVSGVYRNDSGLFTEVNGAGGLSAANASEAERAAEARQAEDWFEAVTGEAFG